MYYPVFIGVTEKFAHLYIGEMSAHLSSMFYKKAGAAFELQKLNAKMTVHEFAHMDNTSFSIDECHDLTQKLENLRLTNQNKNTTLPEFPFYIEDGVINVFHNKMDDLTISVSAYELHTMVASVLRDFPDEQCVYTCLEWVRV